MTSTNSFSAVTDKNATSDALRVSEDDFISQLKPAHFFPDGLERHTIVNVIKLAALHLVSQVLSQKVKTLIK